jgi:hypothetical protein
MARRVSRPNLREFNRNAAGLPSFHSLRLPAPLVSPFTLPCSVTWVPSDKEEAPVSGHHHPCFPFPFPIPRLLRSCIHEPFQMSVPSPGSLWGSKAVEGVGIYCGKSILGKVEKQWSRMLCTHSHVALLNKHALSKQSI